MSTIKNDGGSAFPTKSPLEMKPDGGLFNRAEYEGTEQYQGMTLRDYFAAKAPFGFNDIATHKPSGSGLRTPLTVGEVMDEMARVRYLYADSMLAERAKFYAKEEQK